MSGAGLSLIEGLALIMRHGAEGWARRAMADAMDPDAGRARKLDDVERRLQRHAGDLDWGDAAEPLIPIMSDLDVEIAVLVVDSVREECITVSEIASGSEEHVHIPVEHVVDLAKWHGAGSTFILLHNHPCGDGEIAPMPSACDHRAAIELRMMLRDVSIERYYDAVICGDACRLVRASRLGARYARRNRQ